MKFRIRLAVLFFEVMILLCVCFLALFVLHAIPIGTINQVLDVIYFEPKMRLLFGLVALILLIKTHLMAKAIYGTHEKERNIAFENPTGRVYVTLTALEDLIRRTLAQLDEVKEAKIAIRVKKGGALYVETRLILNGDYNIPEMTSHIQKVIQQKVEKTIGSEHTISVEVDVIKILTREKTPDKKPAAEKAEPDANVPFEGYRA